MALELSCRARQLLDNEPLLLNFVLMQPRTSSLKLTSGQFCDLDELAMTKVRAALDPFDTLCNSLRSRLQGLPELKYSTTTQASLSRLQEQQRSITQTVGPRGPRKNLFKRKIVN